MAGSVRTTAIPRIHEPMRRSLALLLSLALPWAPGARAQALFTRLPSQIVAPARLGPYARVERRDFKDVAAGVGYNYRPDSKADSSWATVYYYRGRYPESMPASQRIEAEAREFRASLEYHRAQGDYDRYEIVWAKPVTVRAGGLVLPGYEIVYVYRAGEMSVLSTFNVYVAGRNLIKVRGSVVGSQAEHSVIVSFGEAVTGNTILANDPPRPAGPVSPARRANR